MRKIWKNLVAILFVVLFTPDMIVAEGLDDAEFRRLHGLLQPDEEELWRTIPWQTGLLDAQQLAAQANKPIFIWAMDGHPLGCT
jgi:hypothetical protein